MAVVSGVVCKIIARKFIESTPEWDENFAAKVQLNSGIRNGKIGACRRGQNGGGSSPR
jgi:hypothetical protein